MSDVLKLGDSIILDYFIEKDADSVWQLLTEHRLMSKWFFDNIPDFKPELEFEVSFPVFSGNRIFTHEWKVIRVVENLRIAYSWRYKEYPGDSTVQFDVVALPMGTALRVSIEILKDFPNDIPEFQKDSCINGWNFFINDRLAETNISID